MNKAVPFVLVASSLLWGCAEKTSATNPTSNPEAAPSSSSQTAVVPKAFLEQAGMSVLSPSPAPEGEMKPYYMVADDSIALVAPMSTAEPVKVKIGKGDHDVTMMQETCTGKINVSVSGSTTPESFSLSQKTTKQSPIAGSDAAERTVVIAMDPAAENNFGCNVLLRHRL